MSSYARSQPCDSQRKHFKALGCVFDEESLPPPGYVAWKEPITQTSFELNAKREFKNRAAAASCLYSEIAFQARAKLQKTIKDALSIKERL